jgi:SAM-dependent methyltransferase
MSNAAPAPTVFDASQADGLIESDASHWWFAAKAAVVRSLVARFAPWGAPAVDLGAGAGGVTALLGGSRAPIVAIEGSRELTKACAAKGLRAAQGLASAVPARSGAFGSATLLDVIEHLADPCGALVEARRILAPDGVLVITVPAHRWLWSDADVFLGHVKRYTRRALRAELSAAGFDVLWCSHVFSWLVPAVAFRRLVRSGGGPALGLEVDGTLVRSGARGLAALERAVTRVVRLPLGTSIACVASPRPCE